METPKKSADRCAAGRSPRRAVPLKERLSKRLSTYALAAGAAGVGVLTVAPPAEAEIIQSSMEWSFSSGSGNFQIDINGDGIPDFAFSGGVSAGSISRGLVDVGSLFFTALHGGILRRPQARGALIGPQDKFVAGTAADFEHIDLYTGGSSTFITGGPWLDKSGYLGFRFTSNGRFHYGWADFGVSVSSDGRSGNAFFGPYAYDTVPGQSIRAGQTSQTPEPATLGLLALGSLGLGFWRRKKQELASVT